MKTASISRSLALSLLSMMFLALGYHALAATSVSDPEDGQTLYNDSYGVTGPTDVAEIEVERLQCWVAIFYDDHPPSRLR